MKLITNLFLTALIGASSYTCAFGFYTPAPSPTPPPDAAIDKKINANAQPTGRQGNYFESYPNQGATIGSRVIKQTDILRIAGRHLEQLYRKPTSDELKKIAPDRRDSEKYKAFLDKSGTGLTKLVGDAGCADNSKVISAAEECLRFQFPGAGASFSFRLENYRLPRLADLTFSDKSFQATGHYLHGIFVNIGDVPLESVDLQTPGLKFLNEFEPSTEYEAAVELDKVLSVGVRHDGFFYRRALYAKENTTFVLRSIAYDGKSFRAIRGFTYNELDFDKRRDVIVAFRVVRFGDDGSVTILWKKISDEKSPKLKRE